MKDIIADVLDTVKLKSAVYFKHGFCGDWGMEVPKGNFAQFHFVAGGNCVLEIDSQQHDLYRGDLAIFPNGYPHRIKANHEASCQSGMDVVMGILNGNDPFKEQGQVNTNLVCGHYELDRDISHFILADLPEFILIKSEEYGRFDSINTILDLIIDELSDKKPGHEIVTLRLAEILFISIIRHYFLNQTTSSVNLFKDEAIYNIVNYIHDNIQADLSIDTLSRHSGISRTLFIERFKNTVGNTPLVYIRSWRMTKAKYLLKHSDLSLGEVSEEVGYGSPSAFNRVFKQTFDISPKRFRNFVN